MSKRRAAMFCLAIWAVSIGWVNECPETAINKHSFTDLFPIAGYLTLFTFFTKIVLFKSVT